MTDMPNFAKLPMGGSRFKDTKTAVRQQIIIEGDELPAMVKMADRSLIFLPREVSAWGMYFDRGHQEAWLLLTFLTAWRTFHEDEAGRTARLAAWENIPTEQWPALALAAARATGALRQMFARSEHQAVRSVTRGAVTILRDLILPLEQPVFPEDQDKLLASSSISNLVKRLRTAGSPRAGTVREALELLAQLDLLCREHVQRFGGDKPCRQAAKTVRTFQQGSYAADVTLPAGWEKHLRQAGSLSTIQRILRPETWRKLRIRAGTQPLVVNIKLIT